jgi:hypothetical protein
MWTRLLRVISLDTAAHVTLTKLAAQNYCMYMIYFPKQAMRFSRREPFNQGLDALMQHSRGSCCFFKERAAQISLQTWQRMCCARDQIQYFFLSP